MQAVNTEEILRRIQQNKEQFSIKQKEGISRIIDEEILQYCNDLVYSLGEKNERYHEQVRKFTETKKHKAENYLKNSNEIIEEITSTLTNNITKNLEEILRDMFPNLYSIIENKKSLHITGVLNQLEQNHKEAINKELFKLFTFSSLIMTGEQIIPELDGENKKILYRGDIHGDVNSLQQTLQELETSKADALVCTGDYADRGVDALGCLTRLFLKKIQYPDSVVLLKGNHDSSDYAGDFLQNLYKHDHDTARSIQNIFSLLPLACEVRLEDGSKTFAVHASVPIFFDTHENARLFIDSDIVSTFLSTLKSEDKENYNNLINEIFGEQYEAFTNDEKVKKIIEGIKTIKPELKDDIHLICSLLFLLNYKGNIEDIVTKTADKDKVEKLKELKEKLSSFKEKYYKEPENIETPIDLLKGFDKKFFFDFTTKSLIIFAMTWSDVDKNLKSGNIEFNDRIKLLASYVNEICQQNNVKIFVHGHDHRQTKNENDRIGELEKEGTIEVVNSAFECKFKPINFLFTSMGEDIPLSEGSSNSEALTAPHTIINYKNKEITTTRVNRVNVECNKYTYERGELNKESTEKLGDYQRLVYDIQNSPEYLNQLKPKSLLLTSGRFAKPILNLSQTQNPSNLPGINRGVNPQDIKPFNFGQKQNEQTRKNKNPVITTPAADQKNQPRNQHLASLEQSNLPPIPKRLQPNKQVGESNHTPVAQPNPKKQNQSNLPTLTSTMTRGKPKNQQQNPQLQNQLDLLTSIKQPPTIKTVAVSRGNNGKIFFQQIMKKKETNLGSGRRKLFDLIIKQQIINTKARELGSAIEDFKNQTNRRQILMK